jgi:hypothetical protein
LVEVTNQVVERHALRPEGGVHVIGQATDAARNDRDAPDEHVASEVREHAF